MKKNTIQKFDKDLFKRSVLYNVKTLYRKTLEEATDQQIFQAVSYAIKDAVVDHWLTTQKEYEKEDPKTLYYLSMEFLMGRALGNNIINLKAYKPVKEALEELGLNLDVIEDQEPDAASGVSLDLHSNLRVLHVLALRFSLFSLSVCAYYRQVRRIASYICRVSGHIPHKDTACGLCTFVRDTEPFGSVPGGGFPYSRSIWQVIPSTSTMR